jgi:hypothetical protein
MAGGDHQIKYAGNDGFQLFPQRNLDQNHAQGIDIKSWTVFLPFFWHWGCSEAMTVSPHSCIFRDFV